MKFIILKPNLTFLDKLLNNKYLQAIKQSSIGQYIHQKIFELKYNISYRYISKEFLYKNYNLLIVCSDRHLNVMEYVLMKYSKNKNINILIPYLVYTAPDGYITGIKNNKNYTMTENDYFYKKYIFNKFKHLSFKNYHAYQPFFYMFLYNKKLLSNNPWVLGAGLATKTLVCNKKVFNEYIANNPFGNYEIIGDLTYLKLQKSLNDKSIRSNIYNEYNLKNKKNLIYAIPPYIELGMVKKETYTKRIEINLKSLQNFKDRYNILISLHPSMNYLDYKYLEDIFDIKIIKQELSTFLHTSDLYVTYPSSTVMWSVLLGIKTLILGDIVNDNLYGDLKTPIFLTKFKNINKIVKYIQNSYIPDFKDDWKILSKESCFHNNLEQDYYNIIDSMIKVN
ncbi:hypothetical protein ACN4FE_07705 [Aliarcobacter butzleri]|uniref:hypothetical protein n=1 Tax=Aliarcobacter butzleri TaxID=28197 RepID=UPI001EDB9BFF|nr:hypothetical protein [Aliarcobacter butzleri]MCG3688113.1 hypothetical protein [Aliarcobacter butzleri]